MAVYVGLSTPLKIMTGDQLIFKMATTRGQAGTDQVFARVSISGIRRQEEACAAADKDLGGPPTSSAKNVPKCSVTADWLRAPPFNLGGGAGFR